jgi:hypothetical protein
MTDFALESRAPNSDSLSSVEAILVPNYFEEVSKLPSVFCRLVS